LCGARRVCEDARVAAQLTVLILGGYGAFGGRLARLLCDDERLKLVIAGRSITNAETFCAALGGAAWRRAAAVDRDGDVARAIAALKPAVVVDASGPFQAYGADPYRIARAALAAGAHYLDLADGSDFVRGIAQLDAEAKAKGKFVLAGASSFPVLHAAVVRRLARDLAAVESSTVGIAPVPYAGVGSTVMRAIASYAGKPVRLVRGGRTSSAFALCETRRFTVAPPGRMPLAPLTYSLVDVPDLEALALVRPEIQEVWAGAAPTPAFLHWLLRVLAHSVRLKVVPSLAPFAPLMHRAVNALKLGERRGGMFVEIRGAKPDGTRVTRSGHLVAEGEDGPNIPSMAAEILVRRVLDGGPAEPGARAAVSEIELDEYERAFAGRAIRCGERSDELRGDVPLYRAILGAAWAELPQAVRDLHGSVATSTVAGRATVTRGTGFLAERVARWFRFPPAAEDVELKVTFRRANGVETWERRFGEHVMKSEQFAGKGRYDGLLCERFGPFTFGLALVVEDGKLALVARRWSVLGIPLPRRLIPGGDAFETASGPRFELGVSIDLPLVGNVVRYSGWLEPTSTPDAGGASSAYLD
jgi:hypothetical protein